MTTAEFFIGQYTDIAFWLGSTTGAMLDPILWVAGIVAANVKGRRVLAVVLVAILAGVGSTWLGAALDESSGLDTSLNWLHLPTRILAALIIGFAAIQVMKLRSRKADTAEAA